MLYDSNCATDKETRKSVSALVDTLWGTLITCFSKTQRTVTLSSTEAEYAAMSACTLDVKFISMLLGEKTEVEYPSDIYEDNQGAMFQAKNRQVGIRTKHIDICHQFLQDMVEDKYFDI